jgi:hypothetical protein
MDNPLKSIFRGGLEKKSYFFHVNSDGDKFYMDIVYLD